MNVCQVALRWTNLDSTPLRSLYTHGNGLMENGDYNNDKKSSSPMNPNSTCSYCVKMELNGLRRYYLLLQDRAARGKRQNERIELQWQLFRRHQVLYTYHHWQCSNISSTVHQWDNIGHPLRLGSWKVKSTSTGSCNATKVERDTIWICVCCLCISIHTIFLRDLCIKGVAPRIIMCYYDKILTYNLINRIDR